MLKNIENFSIESKNEKLNWSNDNKYEGSNPYINNKTL